MSRIDTSTGPPRPTARVIALAATVLLTLILVGWFLLRGDTADSTPEPAPTDTPTAVDDPTTTDDPSPTDTSTDDPPAAPTDPLDELTFVGYVGLELPVHPTAGPTNVEPNGRASGFQNSELGAALAAVHLGARASGFGPLDVLAATINEQFVATDDRSRLLAEATRINEATVQETGDDTAPSTGGEIVGFRVVGFSAGESATVDVLAFGEGVFGSTRLDLVYLDGSWRAQPPPQGSWASRVTAPADPAGFTIWKDF